MRKLILFLMIAGVCGMAQAALVTLIDNTLTGGNGQFEYPGAKTAANGWQTVTPTQMVRYYTWMATDQGVGDSSFDTIVPGWVLTNGGTFGLDSRAGNSTVGQDLDMAGNTYLFANASHTGYAWSTVEMPIQAGNVLHVGFWLRASATTVKTSAQIRLGSAVGVATGLTEIFNTYTYLGGAYLTNEARYFSFDYTVTAADEAAGLKYMTIKLYANIGQPFLDDVTVTADIPEPATIMLLGLGCLTMLRRKR